MKKISLVSEKQLRQLARAALANYLSGASPDPSLADRALQVLHAPQRKGE